MVAFWRLERFHKDSYKNEWYISQIRNYFAVKPTKREESKHNCHQVVSDIVHVDVLFDCVVRCRCIEAVIIHVPLKVGGVRLTAFVCPNVIDPLIQVSCKICIQEGCHLFPHTFNVRSN